MDTRDAPATPAPAPRDSDASAAADGAVLTPMRYGTVWCAVGGERGGDIVPRWFGAVPELGAARVHLFWALPETASPASALDRLRSISVRWLSGLQALGLEGELTIKRGAPGPWLTALAELADDSLIVTGPPAWRGAESETIAHLLAHATRPLLLLPDLVQPPEGDLFAHPVVDAGPSRELHLPGPDGDSWDGEGAEWLDLAGFDPPHAVRTALRLAEDVDASLLVLPRRRAELVPLALQHGNFPILVPGRSAAP
jgi:hypothetical protein